MWLPSLPAAALAVALVGVLLSGPAFARMRPYTCVDSMSRVFPLPSIQDASSTELNEEMVTWAVPTSVSPVLKTEFTANFIPNPFHFNNRKHVKDFLNMAFQHFEKTDKDGEKHKCKPVKALKAQTNSYPGMVVVRGPSEETVLSHFQLVHRIKSPVVVALGQIGGEYFDYFSEKFCKNDETKRFPEGPGWQIKCQPPKIIPLTKGVIWTRDITIGAPTHTSQVSQNSILTPDIAIGAPPLHEEHTFKVVHVPISTTDYPALHWHDEFQEAFRIVEEATRGAHLTAGAAFEAAEKLIVQHLNTNKIPTSMTEQTVLDATPDIVQVFTQTPPLSPIGVAIVHCRTGLTFSGTFTGSFLLSHFLDNSNKYSHLRQYTQGEDKDQLEKKKQKIRNAVEYLVFLLKLSRSHWLVGDLESYYDIAELAGVPPEVADDVRHSSVGPPSKQQKKAIATLVDNDNRSSDSPAAPSVDANRPPV